MKGSIVSSDTLRVAVGADPFALTLKGAVMEHLSGTPHEIVDVGVGAEGDDTPYYGTAAKVARMIAAGEVDRGILVCGTGMGMAIVANKFKGVYAAVCENPYAAKMSRAVNDSNVLTLGEFITAPHLAGEIIDTWLATAFTEGFDEHVSGLICQFCAGVRELEEEL